MKILKVKGHLIKKNKINKNISLFDVNDCLYNIFTYLFFYTFDNNSNKNGYEV